MLQSSALQLRWIPNLLAQNKNKNSFKNVRKSKIDKILFDEFQEINRFCISLLFSESRSCNQKSDENLTEKNLIFYQVKKKCYQVFHVSYHILLLSIFHAANLAKITNLSTSIFIRYCTYLTYVHTHI